MPSVHLAALAVGQHINDEEGILILRCQKCGGVCAWVEWVDFNSRCPDCGATRAEIAYPEGENSDATGDPIP